MGEILWLDIWRFKTRIKPYVDNNLSEERPPPSWRQGWAWPPNNLKRKYWRLFIVARFRGVRNRLKRLNAERLAKRETHKGDLKLIQGGYDEIASKTIICV
jgi:hypothetical protein